MQHVELEESAFAFFPSLVFAVSPLCPSGPLGWLQHTLSALNWGLCGSSVTLLPPWPSSELFSFLLFSESILQFSKTADGASMHHLVTTHLCTPKLFRISHQELLSGFTNTYFRLCSTAFWPCGFPINFANNLWNIKTLTPWRKLY